MALPYYNFVNYILFYSYGSILHLFASSLAVPRTWGKKDFTVCKVNWPRYDQGNCLWCVEMNLLLPYCRVRISASSRTLTTWAPRWTSTSSTSASISSTSSSWRSEILHCFSASLSIIVLGSGSGSLAYRFRFRPSLQYYCLTIEMRSSLVVRGSDCQCTSCNGPGFDPSIRRHSGIWGAADEAVLNIVRKKKKSPPNYYSMYFFPEGRQIQTKNRGIFWTR